jgi:hypothetical protein
MTPGLLEMRENVKQGGGMDTSTIIAKLRAHESELKAVGIEHLSLYGSYARGTAVRDLSDVDVIAEFTPGRWLSLLDWSLLSIASLKCWAFAWICPRQEGSRSQLPPKPHERP